MMRRELRMVSVAAKAPTMRRATATGALSMSRAAYAMLASGRLPKGDAFGQAEVAGISGAKRTSQTLPLCHPLPLDQVEVWFELEPSRPGVRAFCRVSTEAKTGVEMEALCGVSTALLAVYDLVKPVDPALTIGEIRLQRKEGGKSGVWTHPLEEAPAKPERAARLGAAAVITVSDRCSRGEAEDLSGPDLAAGLKSLGFKTRKPLVIPDELDRIRGTISKLSKTSDLIVLTGGTGLSARDVTPEAVESVCDRLIPGIGEALRADGAASTPMAAISRSLAGQLGRALVVALPGSRGAVADALRVLGPILPHALHVVRGGKHGK